MYIHVYVCFFFLEVIENTGAHVAFSLKILNCMPFFVCTESKSGRIHKIYIYINVYIPYMYLCICIICVANIGHVSYAYLHVYTYIYI